MKSFALLAIVGLMGCATTGGLKQDPLDQGVSRSFVGNYDTILKAARDATVASGLHLESVDKVSDKTWTLMAKKDASAWS